MIEIMPGADGQVQEVIIIGDEEDGLPAQVFADALAHAPALPRRVYDPVNGYSPLTHVPKRRGSEFAEWTNETWWIPHNAFKYLVDCPNPAFIIMLYCSGKFELNIKPWGGLIEFDQGYPRNGTLLKTVHTHGLWDDVYAPLVYRCKCRKNPCQKRMPTELTDPFDITLVHWKSALRLETDKGTDWAELPDIFAVTLE